MSAVQSSNFALDLVRYGVAAALVFGTRGKALEALPQILGPTATRLARDSVERIAAKSNPFNFQSSNSAVGQNINFAG